jgi:GNAT superfamily N-acetyltransferase
MDLRYTSPFEREPGIIAWLLNQSYAELIRAQPELWESERKNWEETDKSVFENPDTIGACSFLTWYGTNIVGFFSFDPRPQPAYAVIGHNCILPEFRNQGFGKRQIAEILHQLRQRRIRQARVSTNDHPFFVPAQRMYISCGFVELERIPWDRNPKQNIIHYNVKIG